MSKEQKNLTQDQYFDVATFVKNHKKELEHRSTSSMQSFILANTQIVVSEFTLKKMLKKFNITYQGQRGTSKAKSFNKNRTRHLAMLVKKLYESIFILSVEGNPISKWEDPFDLADCEVLNALVNNQPIDTVKAQRITIRKEQRNV